MSSLLNFAKQPTPVLELKGRMMALSVLRVLTCDLDALRLQLDIKIASAPALFRSLPVLLDFEALPDELKGAFDIARFDRLLRERGFMPVGIRGADDVLAGIAAGVGIGVFFTAPAAEPA